MITGDWNCELANDVRSDSIEDHINHPCHYNSRPS